MPCSTLVTSSNETGCPSITLCLTSISWELSLTSSTNRESLCQVSTDETYKVRSCKSPLIFPPADTDVLGYFSKPFVNFLHSAGGALIGYPFW